MNVNIFNNDTCVKRKQLMNPLTLPLAGSRSVRLAFVQVSVGGQWGFISCHSRMSPPYFKTFNCVKFFKRL